MFGVAPNILVQLDFTHCLGREKLESRSRCRDGNDSPRDADAPLELNRSAEAASLVFSYSSQGEARAILQLRFELSIHWVYPHTAPAERDRSPVAAGG